MFNYMIYQCKIMINLEKNSPTEEVSRPKVGKLVNNPFEHIEQDREQQDLKNSVQVKIYIFLIIKH